jgi:hypothetical protein
VEFKIGSKGVQLEFISWNKVISLVELKIGSNGVQLEFNLFYETFY